MKDLIEKIQSRQLSKIMKVEMIINATVLANQSIVVIYIVSTCFDNNTRFETRVCCLKGNEMPWDMIA